MELSMNSLLQCFQALGNSNNAAAASIQLLQFQTQIVPLVTLLQQIYEQSHQQTIRLHALLYLCNVIKRNWNAHKIKHSPQFHIMKKQIKSKFLMYLNTPQRIQLRSLYDALKFICLADYPDNFPSFTAHAYNALTQFASVDTCKCIRDVFLDFANQRHALSRKLFQQHINDLLIMVCGVSGKYNEMIEAKSTFDVLTLKLANYFDQILISLIRIAPIDILDTDISKQIVTFLVTKLRTLLDIHEQCQIKQHLQKNIKGLILQLGHLQTSKPLILSCVLKQYFQALQYVINNNNIFKRSSVFRYALLALRKIIRQFAYYAQDNIFCVSIRTKHMSSNCMDLRAICRQFYLTVFNANTVQLFLNVLLHTPLSDGMEDKNDEKQISVGGCALLLAQSLLEKFPLVVYNLINGLVLQFLSSTNVLTTQVICNVLSVVAMFPVHLKKHSSLTEVPILNVLQHAFENMQLRNKIPILISGWIDYFNVEQLGSLSQLLLSYIANEGSGTELLLNSCQCLQRMLNEKYALLDLPSLLQKILPACIGICQKTQDPSILWPVLQLISSAMVRMQTGWQLLLSNMDLTKFTAALANENPFLVQAFCEVFKTFLCIFPRTYRAPQIFSLVAVFLDRQLLSCRNPAGPKVVELWYLAIRQYSAIQLFHCHFQKWLGQKNPIVIYILEEYLLLKMVEISPKEVANILKQCYSYQVADKNQQEQIKIAILSVQITLLSLCSVHESGIQILLPLIIADFSNFDTTSPTLHNSLLSIVNRLLIVNYQQIMGYLRVINVAQEMFLQFYFKNMQYLTSKASTKINAIALISILTSIGSNFLNMILPHLLVCVIPEIEHEYKQCEKVVNSPTIRFASNVLSERKDQVRRNNCYDQVNMKQYFKSQYQVMCDKSAISTNQIISLLEQKWALRLIQILK